MVLFSIYERGAVLKRKTIITIAVVVLVVAAITTLTIVDMSYGSPRPIIEQPELMQYANVVIDGEDVTDRLDQTDVAELLSRYSCRRMPAKYNNYTNRRFPDERVGIHIFFHDFNTYYLCLGSVNTVYDSSYRQFFGAQKPCYEIINADELLSELESLVIK